MQKSLIVTMTYPYFMVVGSLYIQKLMSDGIKFAKTRLEEKYSNQENDSNWLETTPLCPYNDDAFMIRLFVMEGKPPKGYILADYSSGIIEAFAENLKPEFRYDAMSKRIIQR